MQEYYNTNHGLTGNEWTGPPTEYNYVIDVNKDVYLEDNITIGSPFHQYPNIILKSKDAQNPVTIRGKGFSNGMIQAVGEVQLTVRDIIFDAEEKGTIFWVSGGCSTPSQPNNPACYVLRPSHLIIEDGVILQNGKDQGMGLGGAIYADHYSRITMNGGEIKNCVSSKVGGAICSLSWVHDKVWDKDKNIEVSIPIAEQKPVLIIHGGKIDGNSAKYGGAVYIQNSENQKNVAIINGGEISENNSQLGGGVYIERGSTLTINGGKISGNTSTTSGGGLEVYSTSVVTMTGGEISENTTQQYGGGVGVDDTAIFTMNGGTISLNQAAQGGGVCSLSKDAICELNGGNISKNQARFGGGIFNLSPRTKIGSGYHH